MICLSVPVMLLFHAISLPKTSLMKIILVHAITRIGDARDLVFVFQFHAKGVITCSKSSTTVMEIIDKLVMLLNYFITISYIRINCYK